MTVIREGQGRWCIVMHPCPGVLWTNDTTLIGFEPIKHNDVDPSPVTALIDALNTQPVTEAFELLATSIGRNTVEGDLATWKPNRNRRARLGKPPAVTANDVMDNL